MFDKYGNMDSAKEINEKAEALANDGDNEGLKELARENGIPVEMAEMYLNGETFELTDPMTAAVGKIEVEREELAIEGIIEDWISFIEAECMENEKMAIAVRSKRKSLVGCTAELLLHSMMHQKQVDKQILTEVERQIKLRQMETIFNREYCFVEEKPKTWRCECSACGSVRIRKEKPKQKMICRSCGKTLIREMGNEKDSKFESVYLYQPTKTGSGAWLERKLLVSRHWERQKQKGVIVRELKTFEEIRILVGKGKSWGECYYCISDRNGPFWWYTNPASYRHAAGFIYDRNIREVAENCWPDRLKHRGIEILARQGIRINGNFAVTMDSDILEYLIKKGFFTIAKEMINSYGSNGRYSGSLFAKEGKTAGDILKLDGGRADRLKQLEGGCITLGWLQYEAKMKYRISEQNLKWLEKHGISKDDAWKVLEYEKSPEKFTNYLRKQSERRKQGPNATLTDWIDYLEMAEKQKLNLKESLMVRPKDLKAAHDACVWAGQQKEVEKRRREILKKYPDAEKNLAEIRDKYEYGGKEAGEKYVIVVPESITDIIREGRSLGHCIDTTDRYFDRIEHKTSYLMFLRNASSPDTPWYTLEVEPGGTIRQQRTTGNKQNREDQKAYMPFIRKWQQAVRDRITEEDRKLAEQSRTIRIREYQELREKKETVWHGALAGKLLADVLEADLVEA